MDKIVRLDLKHAETTFKEDRLVIEFTPADSHYTCAVCDRGAHIMFDPRLQDKNHVLGSLVFIVNDVIVHGVFVKCDREHPNKTGRYFCTSACAMIATAPVLLERLNGKTSKYCLCSPKFQVPKDST